MNRDFKIESKDGKKYINGRYCTPCEKFLTYYDVSEDNKCPHCGRDTYIAKSEVTEDILEDIDIVIDAGGREYYSRKKCKRVEDKYEEKKLIKELKVTLVLDKDRLLNDLAERLLKEFDNFKNNIDLNDYVIHR